MNVLEWIIKQLQQTGMCIVHKEQLPALEQLLNILKQDT